MLDLRGGRWLVNPGSTGQPRDGDPRAAWLLLDTVLMSAIYHRAEYDIAAAQAAIRAANLPDYGAHRAAVRAYLDGGPVEGWEARDDALARFRDALAGVDDAAVVTHATVLSLFLGYGFEQWEAIRLPDVIEWQP